VKLAIGAPAPSQYGSAIDSLLFDALNFSCGHLHIIFAALLIKKKIETMKKHIIIFAAAITPLAFFSCQKEKVERQADNTMLGEVAYRPVSKPAAALDSALAGRYEFDGNLKEYSGKLADAVASISGADNYAVDRKGNGNNAINFSGRYGLDIVKVPLTFNTSVAVWVKYDAIAASTNYFAKGDQGIMPDFAQKIDNYWGVVSTPGTSGVPSGPIDNHWHHLVATYDGSELKFYIDGGFIGSSLNPCPLALPVGATTHYQLGYWSQVGSFWRGSMDDLRFYTRVLSGGDVKALYKL
jgi:concanavalin A-like lectin/glucanase superfamily protein